MWVYSADHAIHELLLQSEHRTFDPEEADFFYVPQYSNCMMFPLHGWADFPWFAPPGMGLRVPHAVFLMLQAKAWIAEHHPYWNRTQGRDHIWLTTHDEGACWAPNEIINSIFLTHWGRLELNHTSNTAFASDNYNLDEKSKRLPDGWTHLIKGHACYDPDKDLVVPSFKSPQHYGRSSLVGRSPELRHHLLFFRGDVGKKREARYSRGVRQRLYNLWKSEGWQKKYNVTVAGNDDGVDGPYSEWLSRSKYCLVVPGDGWSARAEDAILHGCVPVVIMDGVHQSFQSVLDWPSFSVQIPEADAERIVDILLAIPERKLRSLQAHLSRVWHRFRYVAGPALANLYTRDLTRNLAAHDGERELQAAVRARLVSEGGAAGRELPRLPRPFRGDPTVDDAFSTIMQWLHSRVGTRGAQAGRTPSA
ncbi:hypothetical protein FOA52_012994 [Chlamydomonas sp. UWO 241]|nr:hypothetical protein FOA52_012994 [Chlamydomonas sp. UWO 241]